MAFTLKYSKTDYLKLVHTGNTVGIGVLNGNPSTFISLDTLANTNTTVGVSTAPTTFAGNTLTWQKDGSWAILNPSTSDVPTGSTVDFAALIWVTCATGVVTLPLLDSTAVTFGLPDGTTVPVTMDPAYSADGTNNLKPFNTRGREVTNIVKALPNSGLGNYSVSNIPADTPNFGVGWGLVLVYKHSSMPLRNVSLNTGFLVNGAVTTISGFYTPVTGTVQARAFVMGQYGFSGIPGDTFTLNGQNLSGPRNPATNFFAAQVCDYQGNLLTTSSFGDRNCTPGVAPANPKGDRVDIDLTNVSASGVIGNAVRTVSASIAGNGDIVSANAIGLEINANAPLITLTKTANPSAAAAGDTVTYTVVVKNTGSTTANNMIFVDTIPTGTTFVNDTVTVNGSATPSGTNPQTGFSLNSLAPTSGVSTVTFKVILNSGGFTAGQTIPNSAFAGYNFINDPSLPALTGGMDSNIAIVTLTIPKATISKNVSLNYATSGETLQYTLVINNNSNPSTVTNITLIDTIPAGVTFVPGSVLINNSASTGNPSPPTGLSIPNVAGSSSTTITFNVIVNTIPNVNSATNSGVMTLTQDGTTFTRLSNSVVTTLNYLVLTSSKIVNKTFANIGDILTYTIPITNLGNLTATNVLFADTIPNGTTLVSNSFKQDGNIVSGSPNPPGITLPNAIGINKTSTITFQIQIITTPNPNPIPNTASTFSTFTIDSTTTPNRTSISSTNTNTVNTTVNFASLSGITKLVDKSFATCSDVLNYTIIAPNTGTVTALNVVFKDTIPNGTVLVANSVFVNGVQQTGSNPATGVTIPNIGPGATATLTFSVQIQC